jgi:hypothetical protein
MSVAPATLSDEDRNARVWVGVVVPLLVWHILSLAMFRGEWKVAGFFVAYIDSFVFPFVVMILAIACPTDFRLAAGNVSLVYSVILGDFFAKTFHSARFALIPWVSPFGCAASAVLALVVAGICRWRLRPRGRTSVPSERGVRDYVLWLVLVALLLVWLINWVLYEDPGTFQGWCSTYCWQTDCKWLRDSLCDQNRGLLYLLKGNFYGVIPAVTLVGALLWPIRGSIAALTTLALHGSQIYYYSKGYPSEYDAYLVHIRPDMQAIWVTVLLNVVLVGLICTMRQHRRPTSLTASA